MSYLITRLYRNSAQRNVSLLLKQLLLELGELEELRAALAVTPRFPLVHRTLRVWPVRDILDHSVSTKSRTTDGVANEVLLPPRSASIRLLVDSPLRQYRAHSLRACVLSWLRRNQVA